MRRLLEREHDVEVVAEAGDLFSAMRHVNHHLPHVLLLDLQMPDASSIDTIRRLRLQVPETQIVVTTTDGSSVLAQQALDAGAAGYTLKPTAPGELVEAVRCAAGGRGYVSPRMSASLESLQRAASEDGLSAREADVLRLVALGFTNAEISEQLHLSRRTVESHRLRIHRKLGFHRRSELVGYALQRHLIGG